MLKSMDPGLWETIGGTVESKESSLEAIKREVSEELGNEIMLKDIEYLKQYSFKAGLKKLQTDVFIARTEGIPNPSSKEIEKLEWFEKEKALELDFCINCKQRIEDFFRIKSI